MKASLSSLICGISLLLFISNAGATVYYVSSEGSDANPGTESQPWRYCPGMRGWSDSRSLKAGDIVYFRNTDIWTASVGGAILQVKGGVTYDGRAWGTGSRAVLRATGDISRSVVNFTDDHPTEPTIVRGFDLDANNTVTTGVAINWPSASRSLVGADKVLEDCLVHNVYSRQFHNQYEYGVLLGSVNGLTVKNVRILNCKVYNISRGGISCYVSNDDPRNKLINVTIRGCEVYNTGTDPGAPGVGSGIGLKNHIVNCTVEFNYIHDVKLAGIPITTHPEPGFRGAENAIIRYNIIRNCGQIGIWALNGGNKSFEIYGNLIINNRYKGIWLLGTLEDTLSVKIYNNVLYQNYASSDYYEILISKSKAIFKCLEIKNNIIYSAPSGRPLTDLDGSITAHSNNIYYRPGGGALVNIKGKGYTSANLQSWEPTAYSDNPNFKDISNLPTGFKGVYGTDMEPDSDGFSIDSGVANDNGADLGELYKGAINFSGKSPWLARPYEMGWDIGAYEAYGIIGTISGTVADSITGNPIEGAFVSDGIRSDETDAEGNYSIEYVPFNQTYMVTALKSGYLSLSIDSVVVAEDSTSIVDFQLTRVPTGTISGTVTDSITGNPLQGALVTDGIRSDTTDASGNYSFTNVPVDTFMITISLSNYLPLSMDGIVVVKDSTTIVDLHLQRVPTGTISGIVTEATTGHPVEGASVSNGTASVTTDTDGNYIMDGLLLDIYTVSASASGYKPVSTDGVAVTKNDTNRVDFQLIEFPDLVGFWAFEESSGTNAFDSTENHNDGILHGPTSTSGRFDLALQFDGTDDYVTIPKSISLDNITKEITLMAWIRVSSGSRHSIFERWLSGPNAEERSFLFDVKKGQMWFGLSADGTINDSRFLLSSGSVPVDTWTHVAATSDGSEMKIYINGIPDPETKSSPLFIHPSAADLHLGRGEFVTNGWDYPFNGTMDQVKIYNRALSAQEVAADYQLAFVGIQNNPAHEHGVLQVYPNPFHDAITISYKTTVRGKVTISIYNTLGQKIRTLVSATQQADDHSLVWDGTKTGGEPAGSGVYSLTFNIDQQLVATRKLVLLK